MSALRKCLGHPATYIALLIVLGAAISADSLRSPKKQRCVVVYVAIVHSYQRFVSPRLRGHVECRYIPTCSHYSVQAVEKYGMRKGLVLTTQRLWRCRRGVALGTQDPVP